MIVFFLNLFHDISVAFYSVLLTASKFRSLSQLSWTFSLSASFLKHWHWLATCVPGVIPVLHGRPLMQENLKSHLHVQ